VPLLATRILVSSFVCGIFLVCHVVHGSMVAFLAVSATTGVKIFHILYGTSLLVNSNENFHLVAFGPKKLNIFDAVWYQLPQVLKYSIYCTVLHFWLIVTKIFIWLLLVQKNCIYSMQCGESGMFIPDPGS
jgi:hypothetical protein